MEMSMEHLASCRIAYVRQVGPYGSANVQAMNQLKQWANEKRLLTEAAVLFGIPQDNPSTTPPHHCRYDAAIVLHELELPEDDSIEIGELQGGNYLICKVRHTPEGIQQAWNEIIPYLQNNRYIIDQQPVLERYRWDLLEQHECEICVPVKQV
ncbi:GyrI-like domain-containing protein [Paenibacillus sp. 7516]|uniref:AraC family transcriptional regulator n=1 Tax=Paenibacillus sp. 7516 TaxID=2022549 RepID=UPI000BA7C4DD|nr:GyrI-like domain-containing protein [Paenibacillus sp. 7516]PAF32895.1 DNA gyrase inhibitor [Paenibacillus sp. 7516]